MSLFKKLKNIFGEEHNEEVEVPQAPSADGASAKKMAKPESKFTDMLLRAIEANNIDGFDYLEFKQSLQSLSQVEAEEAKRYKSAFVMAQTMGLSKKKLFDSAKHYMNILKEEESKFADAFSKQKSAQVHQREQTVSSLQQSIKVKEAKIAQLREEIEESNAELEGIEEKINKALAKVEATRDGFYASYELVVRQIQKDIDKIKNYI